MRISGFSTIRLNVVNMLNSRVKKNDDSSIELLLAQLPDSAVEKTKIAPISDRTQQIENSIIAMQGGTATQKIAAMSDTSYYTKRYERTDGEVLNDIRLAKAETSSDVATKREGKDTVNTEDRILPEYTKEEKEALFKANIERFGERIKVLDTGISLDRIASESLVANEFLKGLASDIEYTANPTDRSLVPKGNWAEYTVDENGNVSGANIDYTLDKLSAESLVNIDCKIDDLSALYAFYTDKVNSKYSGEECAAVMAKVDEMFECKMTELGDLMCKGYNTNDYTVVGTMTKANGEANSMVCSNDEDGIRSSMMEVFNKRSAEYIELINSNNFSTGVENTENEWAEDSAEFMVHKLHQQIETSISDIETEKYSSADLKAFSIMQMQYTVTGDRNDDAILWGDYNSMNEEAIGAYIGMIGIQTKQITNYSNISEAAKKLLNDSFTSYISKAIEYANEQMKSYSKYLQAHNGFSSLDTDRILSNINAVMNAYSNSEKLQTNLQGAFEELSYNTVKVMSEQFNSGSVDCRYENINTALGYMDWVSSEFFTTKFNMFEQMIGNNSCSIKNVQKVDTYI